MCFPLLLLRGNILVAFGRRCYLGEEKKLVEKLTNVVFRRPPPSQRNTHIARHPRSPYFSVRFLLPDFPPSMRKYTAEEEEDDILTLMHFSLEQVFPYIRTLGAFCAKARGVGSDGPEKLPILNF